jgi:type II secretory pathway pseudopilin PulG
MLLVPRTFIAIGGESHHMKGLSLVVIVILLTILLSACAPAVPTIDPAQVQASALAAAGTMIASTQAALPTATPVPPTPLPSPTAQPSPTLMQLTTLPSLSGSLSPTVQPSSGNAGADPCKGPLSSHPGGPLTTIKISNGTRAPVTVSIGLTAKTAFGDCGYRSYALGPSDSVYLTDLPFGCYWAFAFVNDPKKPSQASGAGAMCPNNDDKWTMVVQPEVIKFYSP